MTLSEMFSGLCGAPDEELLAKLMWAHRSAALVNENLSSTVARSAFVGSGDMGKAIAAGICTLGYLHAPILQARQVLDSWTDELIEERVKAGERVPGWGNTFFKERIDPAWSDTYQACLPRPSFERVLSITALLQSLGKNVTPNAAALTAYCCDEMEWMPGAEVVLVIVARAPIWGQLGILTAKESPTLAGQPPLGELA